MRVMQWTVVLLACLGATTVGCSKNSESSLEGDASGLPIEQRLIRAAITGDADQIESILAENPALVNCQGTDGRTPLHYAAANGQDSVVEILLENGSDPSIQDEEGSTPQSAALQAGNPATAKLIANHVAQGPSTPQDNG